MDALLRIITLSHVNNVILLHVLLLPVLRCFKLLVCNSLRSRGSNSVDEVVWNNASIIIGSAANSTWMISCGVEALLCIILENVMTGIRVHMYIERP